MKTQAYFENIQEKILTELVKANDSIFIAVAWFTDPELFEVLFRKVKSGVKVELVIMNDKINNSSSINYERLNTQYGKLWRIGDIHNETALMHNKFCVIDSLTIISGSYNWTKKAKKNHESITIIYDAPDVALDFLEEFSSIKKKYFGSIIKDEEFIDINMLSIRLDTLKNVVLLEDEEDVKYQLKKLKTIVKPSGIVKEFNDLNEIINYIENQKFGEAISAINKFVNKYKQLSIYIDSEIFALKLEVRTLELNISALEDEKIDIEKLIYHFEIRYNNELGELVLKLLELKRRKLKKEVEIDDTKKKEYDEAEKDYKEFSKDYEESKDKATFEITEEQKIELKDKFRKASKLCHPDVVEEKFKNKAEKIFKDLKEAYEQNDFVSVDLIYQNLIKGIFKSKSMIVNEKQYLKILVNELGIKRISLEKKLNELKKSFAYIEIAGINNWDEYFEKTKLSLMREIEQYEK
jgi:hypothetical protein